MLILGLESSCDETAAAVVRDGHELLSNVVASSMDKHAMYGGVIPEIAARSHIEVVLPTINQALQTANVSWDELDGIAVTYGAGLGGSLLVGVLTARTLAITYAKPLYKVNHVAAHVAANFLTSTPLPGFTMPDSQPKFPMLAIIVSGGHTQLALFESHFEYRLLGQTRDDAVGEAFDKVAKIIGLPYPGGPNVSKAALNGNNHAYTLPSAHLDNPYDFSFSGLKTAVLRQAQAVVGRDHTLPSFEIPAMLNGQQKADIAASFQWTAIDTIVRKAIRACDEFAPQSVVIAGGVAANQELRRQLQERLPLPINFPDMKLCTDNGAMIATLGCFQAMAGEGVADPYSLDISPNLSM